MLFRSQTTLAGSGGLVIYLLMTWKLKSRELQSIYQEIKLEFRRDDEKHS